MVICPNCGHSFPISTYCILCGEKMENIRTCNTCNNLYLNKLQSCPHCSTPLNHYPSPKYVSYLMYFQPTLSIVFLLSSYFILQMILGFISYSLFPELSQDESVISNTISLMIIIISNLIYILILTKYYPYKNNDRKMGSNPLPNIITILGLFILCISFLELTLTFLNYFFDQLSLPPSFSSPYDDYLGNPSTALIFAFLVILIGPIFEEIVFRKYISYFLESNISSKLFVVFLSGVIFSLNHLPADLLNGSFRFTLEHLYVVFILGLVLGVIYYNYGLFYSILFHSLWNSFTFLTQIENLIPDPVLLSNLLFTLGLISIIILPGILVYKKKEKVTNMKNFLWDRLSSRKLSLPVFTNTLTIIIYEFLVAILLVTYQSVLSTLLLLGIHTLGIILGFIVLDTDLRASNNF